MGMCVKGAQINGPLVGVRHRHCINNLLLKSVFLRQTIVFS